jgi:hypothetical protein
MPVIDKLPRARHTNLEIEFSKLRHSSIYANQVPRVRRGQHADKWQWDDNAVSESVT